MGDAIAAMATALLAERLLNARTAIRLPTAGKMVMIWPASFWSATARKPARGPMIEETLPPGEISVSALQSRPFQMGQPSSMHLYQAHLRSGEIRLRGLSLKIRFRVFPGFRSVKIRVPVLVSSAPGVPPAFCSYCA